MEGVDNYQQIDFFLDFRSLKNFSSHKYEELLFSKALHIFVKVPCLLFFLDHAFDDFQLFHSF